MKNAMGFVIVLLLVCTSGFGDYNPEDQYTARAYDDAKVIRVKYTLGETYVRRSYEEGLEEATLNLPVFENDSVGTTDGRLELYLGRLNYIRLDYDTEVSFEQVPELRKTRTTVRIDRGGLYLFVNNIDFQRDIQIQTPDCGIFILQSGNYQIIVNGNGESEVSVFRGAVLVSGRYDDMELDSMQKVSMFDGQAITAPDFIAGFPADDFGIWNRERDLMIKGVLDYRSRYLHQAYADYEYELSASGKWQYEPTYNSYIWIPYNPGYSWKPYFSGRWIYHPYYGYVWTSYDRWGWFTHHYGRWHWSPVYGWYWLPGTRWSPAWVSWFYTENYYGWCPLSRWNRPVIVINNQWIKNYRYQSGLPFDVHSLIVIKRTSLWSHRINTIVLSRQVLHSLRNHKLLFKGRIPTLKPEIRYVSIVNAKGKMVRYKQTGFLRGEKYRTVKSNNEKGRVSYKYQVENEVNGYNKRVNRYSITNRNVEKTARPNQDTRVKSVRPDYKPLPEKKYLTARPVSKVPKSEAGQSRLFKKKDADRIAAVPRNQVENRKTIEKNRQSAQHVVNSNTVKSTSQKGTESKHKESQKRTSQKKKKREK